MKYEKLHEDKLKNKLIIILSRGIETLLDEHYYTLTENLEDSIKILEELKTLKELKQAK